MSATSGPPRTPAVARCIAALESLPPGETCSTSELAAHAGVNASSGLLRHPELLRRCVKLLNRLQWGNLETVAQIKKYPHVKVSELLQQSVVEGNIRAGERRAIRNRW